MIVHHDLVIPAKAGTHPLRWQSKPDDQGIGPRLRGGDEGWPLK